MHFWNTKLCNYLSLTWYEPLAVPVQQSTDWESEKQHNEPISCSTVLIRGQADDLISFVLLLSLSSHRLEEGHTVYYLTEKIRFPVFARQCCVADLCKSDKCNPILYTVCSSPVCSVVCSFSFFFPNSYFLFQGQWASNYLHLTFFCHFLIL